MPVEWALSVVVPIFMKKSDIRNRRCYGVEKLLEHEMNVVERVFEKSLHGIVSVEEMLVGAETRVDSELS